MRITKRDANNVSILDIEGEVDLYNSKEFKDTIKELIGQDKKRIIINLEKVGYIDSSGIGSMISSLSMLKKIGGELKIINVFSSVKKVFELTKLDVFFQIYDNEEEAIKSFT